MLFVGVNGVGKTTSIGKLAHRYKQAGREGVLVAADAFRAGAVTPQLADGVTGPEKSWSAVWSLSEWWYSNGIDILMIDTAGRLQNKKT